MNRQKYCNAATGKAIALTLTMAPHTVSLADPPAPADRVSDAFEYSLEDAFAGMKFDQPLGIVSAPGAAERVFVLEKTGRIQLLTGIASSNPEKQVFLDLTHPRDGTLETEGECGLLGLAFPPDCATSRRCFVYYSLKTGDKLHQRLSRFQIDGNRVDAASEQPLWSQVDPASNHNGGDLLFGPDDYLYVSVGDGGGANDQFNNARFINKGFFAAILRMDVNKRPGNFEPNAHPGIARDSNGLAYYSVPADNPFVGATSHHGAGLDPATVRTEIWAAGLRNPWRVHLDPHTGRFFAGDIGQNLYEEVDLITKGADFGWSYREGQHPFPPGPGGTKEQDAFKPVEPIFEYPRTVGISVTGGVVYHGKAFPKLDGAYVFADYGSGLMMALREKDGAWQAENLARDPGIASIGINPHDGEVLFANLQQGKIKRFQRR